MSISSALSRRIMQVTVARLAPALSPMTARRLPSTPKCRPLAATQAVAT